MSGLNSLVGVYQDVSTITVKNTTHKIATRLKGQSWGFRLLLATQQGTGHPTSGFGLNTTSLERDTCSQYMQSDLNILTESGRKNKPQYLEAEGSNSRKDYVMGACRSADVDWPISTELAKRSEWSLASKLLTQTFLSLAMSASVWQCSQHSFHHRERLRAIVTY